MTIAPYFLGRSKRKRPYWNIKESWGEKKINRKKWKLFGYMAMASVWCQLCVQKPSWFFVCVMCSAFFVSFVAVAFWNADTSEDRLVKNALEKITHREKPASQSVRFHGQATFNGIRMPRGNNKDGARMLFRFLIYYQFIHVFRSIFSLHIRLLVFVSDKKRRNNSQKKITREKNYYMVHCFGKDTEQTEYSNTVVVFALAILCYSF